MQPVYLDDNGTARFKENQIISYLFRTGKLDLNELAVIPFHDEDRVQLAQLLGYTVSGAGDLSYFNGSKEGNRILDRAEAAADKLTASNPRKPVS